MMYFKYGPVCFVIKLIGFRQNIWPKLELLTDIGADFKVVQNTHNIKWLPVALALTSIELFVNQSTLRNSVNLNAQ